MGKREREHSSSFSGWVTMMVLGLTRIMSGCYCLVIAAVATDCFQLERTNETNNQNDKRKRKAGKRGSARRNATFFCTLSGPWRHMMQWGVKQSPAVVDQPLLYLIGWQKSKFYKWRPDVLIVSYISMLPDINERVLIAPLIRTLHGRFFFFLKVLSGAFEPRIIPFAFILPHINPKHMAMSSN